MISKDPVIEVHVRMPVPMRNDLRDIAQDTQRSLAQLIRDILQDYLHEHTTQLIVICASLLILN